MKSPYPSPEVEATVSEAAEDVEAAVFVEAEEDVDAEAAAEADAAEEEAEEAADVDEEDPHPAMETAIPAASKIAAIFLFISLLLSAVHIRSRSAIAP